MTNYIITDKQGNLTNISAGWYDRTKEYFEFYNLLGLAVAAFNQNEIKSVLIEPEIPLHARSAHE